MKVIDLLNLVYKKKAPKKILYKYCEYEFSHGINDYKNSDNLELFSYLFSNEEQALFLEVEIIEEDKEIEELDIIVNDEKTGNAYILNEHGTKCFLTKHSKIIASKLNEVIRKVNKIEKEEK